MPTRKGVSRKRMTKRKGMQRKRGGATNAPVESQEITDARTELAAAQAAVVAAQAKLDGLLKAKADANAAAAGPAPMVE
jgi:hypothetical protein